MYKRKAAKQLAKSGIVVNAGVSRAPSQGVPEIPIPVGPSAMEEIAEDDLLRARDASLVQSREEQARKQAMFLAAQQFQNQAAVKKRRTEVEQLGDVPMSEAPPVAGFRSLRNRVVAPRNL